MSTTAPGAPIVSSAQPVDKSFLDKLRPLVERYSTAPPGCRPLQSADAEDLQQTLWLTVLEHASQEINDDDFWQKLLGRTRQQWWRKQKRWEKQHALQPPPESATPWRRRSGYWPPWILLGEPESVYRAQAKEHLTSHQLADFRRCPLLYRKKKLGLIEEEDRPAFLVGRALHTLVLEGHEVFGKDYAVGGPVNPKTGEIYGANTKAFAEWAAQQGKPVLTFQQHDLIQRMAEGVRGHGLATDLLSEGTPEGVVRAEYCQMSCQIRMDWFDPHRGLVDLKTCDDLDWFEADARRYGYVHQVAFYQAVLLRKFERPARVDILLPVHFIAVEKKEPYRSGVWKVHPDALVQARRENEAAIERLRRCMATDTWPSGYEECRVFDCI